MNLADVRINDRCWTGYCPTVDEKGQNATVKGDIKRETMTVVGDNDIEYCVRPGASCFWSRPEFPEKPRRMVKREVKGITWNGICGWSFLEGGIYGKELGPDERPAVLHFEEEEP